MNKATDEDYLRDEAQSDLQPATRYELSTGCWIDSRWGHYGSARLIQITVDLGWDDQDAENFAAIYLVDGDIDVDRVEQVYAAADDAKIWLNENIAKPGFSFGWSDGEFFLMNDSWWESL